MADIAALRGLERRLSEAKGADRELDTVLGIAILGIKKCPMCEEYHDTERWTSSIDAAVALVERALPGWVWHVSSTPTDAKRAQHADAYLMEPDETVKDWATGWKTFEPATVHLCFSLPALALSLSVVRAMIAKEQTP